MDPDERRGAAITIRAWLEEAEALCADVAGSPPAWLAYRQAQETLRLLQELEAALDGWAEVVSNRRDHV